MRMGQGMDRLRGGRRLDGAGGGAGNQAEGEGEVVRREDGVEVTMPGDEEYARHDESEDEEDEDYEEEDEWADKGAGQRLGG